MLERLGNVLYWIGSGICVLLIMVGAYITRTEWENSFPPHNIDYTPLIAFIAGGFLSWAAGKAIRYILIGK